MNTQCFGSPNVRCHLAVVRGLTEDPADAPGPFGVYLTATTHTMQRSVAGGADPIMETQDWNFAATCRSVSIQRPTKPNRARFSTAKNPARFYSAKNPNFFQISRQEQVLDLLRNVTTNPPDRVKEFSFKGGGGSYARLFDGTEKLLSWDNILWINRSVFLP